MPLAGWRRLATSRRRCGSGIRPSSSASGAASTRTATRSWSRAARRRSSSTRRSRWSRAADALPRVDRVLNSHCHEDHVAGNHLFPRRRPGTCTRPTCPGIRSLDGHDGDLRLSPADRRRLPPGRRRRSSTSRRAPTRTAFRDGDVFDLGRRARPRRSTRPGTRAATRSSTSSPTTSSTSATSTSRASGRTTATRGRRSRTSSARSRACATIEARWYATFHHIGVLDGRAAFLERLDRFAAVIATREARLLDFLAAPRTLDEIVAHRFVYRPGDPVSFADDVERRSMRQHLERLVARRARARGRARAVSQARVRASSSSRLRTHTSACSANAKRPLGSTCTVAVPAARPAWRS